MRTNEKTKNNQIICKMSLQVFTYYFNTYLTEQFATELPELS